MKRLNAGNPYVFLTTPQKQETPKRYPYVIIIVSYIEGNKRYDKLEVWF